MDLTLIYKILQFIFPYLVGVVSGIGGMYFSGLLNEHFKEKARVAEHKRNVAKHVLKICNEASTKNFNKQPREIEDINSALTDLDGIDLEMGKVFNNFVTDWGLISGEKVRTYSDFDDKEYLAELRNDVEKKRKTLVDWAAKIEWVKNSTI